MPKPSKDARVIIAEEWLNLIKRVHKRIPDLPNDLYINYIISSMIRDFDTHYSQHAVNKSKPQV